MLSQRRVLLHHRAGILTGTLNNVGIGKRPQEAQGALRARLCSTQNITLAALRQVDAREFKAVRGGGDRVQALAGHAALLLTGHQQAGARVAAAAHTTAQLVQARDAEAVGVHDDHERGVRDVHAHLNDGGADEQVNFAALESGHDGGFLSRVHAAVQGADTHADEGVLCAQVGVH